jgi:DNA-binding Lrp family transcriptional regulator
MLEKIDEQILIELSKDVKVCKKFYGEIAKKLNISEEELLNRLTNMMDKGYIKRIAPIIKHHKTEYVVNALTIWSVSDNKKVEMTNFIKNIENISHVYERKASEKWPYNIYGMIHGRTYEEVEKIICKISINLNLNNYKVLYTKKELKKISPDMEYLLKESAK